MSIKSAACALAICLASSAALAQPVPLPAGRVAGLGPVMPPQQIGKILRANGFLPQATPVRNGEAYQVRAIDRRGRQVRVAIDARYGDILMVRPIIMVPPGALGPRPYGPPPAYYDDDLPTGAVGAYPPAGRTATLAPAHPPIPRPKPAAKPAAVTPAPAPAPEAKPAPAANPAPAAAAAAPAPAAPVPASAPSPPAAMPPVTTLE